MSSRNPIACERCRRLRKRCLLPAPCTGCRVAGVECTQRQKARPQRQSRSSCLKHTPVCLDSSRPVILVETQAVTQVHDVFDGNTSDEISLWQPKSGAVDSRSVQRLDVVERFKVLVSNYTERHFGYHLQCNLAEPAAKFVAYRNECKPQSTINNARDVLESFTNSYVEGLLTMFMAKAPVLKFIVPSQEQLFATYREWKGSSDGLLGFTKPPNDEVASLFAVLALSALWEGDLEESQILATELADKIDDYSGPSSFHLCLAYYLQHIYIVATGTANRARAIIAAAVQVAHDNCPSRSDDLAMLRLYILIILADQYLAQTHNTQPITSMSALGLDFFKALLLEEPQAEVLLVTMLNNGSVLEELANRTVSSSDITRLENSIKIGNLEGPVLSENDSGCYGFSGAILPIVKIHTFWLRILLRLPGLDDPESWMPSISVCSRAAQMILSLYSEMFRTESSITKDLPDSASSQDTLYPNPYPLPRTWRQVRRIMTATFIVFFSYWKGEMNRTDVIHYAEITRSILQGFYARWGSYLRKCIDIVGQLAELSKLDLDSLPSDMLFDHSITNIAMTYDLDSRIPIGTTVEENNYFQHLDFFESFSADTIDLSPDNMSLIFESCQIPLIS